jgi:probable HAF family extracellular repeat protein
MKPTILIAFLSFVVSIASGQVYTITDLGPLTPTAINIWGQVVGNFNGQAFIWTQFTGRKRLGTLTGGTSSYAASINDLGIVIGTADGRGTVISNGVGQPPLYSSPPPNQECSDLTQPFVWTARKGMKGLGAVEVPDPDFVLDWCEIPFYGASINNVGQVVGYTSIFGPEYQYGLLRTSTAGITLFGGSWPPTFASGVSNTGQIVGQSDSSPYSGHATSWKNGIATDLEWLGGAAGLDFYSSSANGVNDLGEIVGWSTTTLISDDGCWSFEPGDITGCPMHAVLWRAGGEIRDLGTLPGDSFSSASNINLFGQVIGSSGNTVVFQEAEGTAGSGLFGDAPIAVIGRPFIWSESSGMNDLNNLISTSSDWVLNSATGINIWGQIVGAGTLDGEAHGFLLTPRSF